MFIRLVNGSFQVSCSVDNFPSTYGPLSSTGPIKTIIEVNKQVSDVERQELKRGEYSKHSLADKAVIGDMQVSMGLLRLYDILKKKRTIRDWKKAYDKELKEKCKCVSSGQAVVVTTLPTKRRGRPPFLSERLDKYLQEMILSMCGRGTPIRTSIIMGIGRGVMLKHNRIGLKKFGGLVNRNVE